MAQPPRSHYDVLGVPHDAPLHKIERAYHDFQSRIQGDETVAPDPRRAMLMRVAYETLSDPERRAAYDEQQRSAAAVLARARESRNGRIIGGAALATALVAVGLWLAMRSGPEDGPERDPADIARIAAAAVGRVDGIDLTGVRKPLGVAFAVGQGALATSCKGLGPTSQIVVSFARRDAPARVDNSFTAGVCRLSAEGLGSWPLEIAKGGAHSGQKAYVAHVDATGGVRLAETRVRRSYGEEGLTKIEVEGPKAPPGAPLLDTQGRVLGVAAETGRYTQLPPQWLAEMRAPPPMAAAPEPPPPPQAQAPRDPIEEEAHRRAQKLKMPDDI